MDGMNSRYKKPDGTTIRTNTGSSTYSDDMNIMEADNSLKNRQAQRASATRGHSGRGAARTRKQTIIYLVIIIIEVLLLVGIWVTYFTSGGSSKSKSSKKEDTTASSESNSSSGGSVNVNNDNFTLTCTKVSITTDTNGGPAALIYFTFVNKTDSPLSMAEVFSPSVMQNGATLSDSVALAQEPQEMINKNTQLSNGDSLDCAYAFALSDSTSPITLIMHDNYETFSDIGSTEIPISQ